jgi:hypothetical protein
MTCGDLREAVLKAETLGSDVTTAPPRREQGVNLEGARGQLAVRQRVCPCGRRSAKYGRSSSRREDTGFDGQLPSSKRPCDPKRHVENGNYLLPFVSEVETTCYRL